MRHFVNMLRMGAALLAGVVLAGCVVQETRPLAKIEARQALQVIPDEQRLDVVVHTFDPGIPENLKDDEDALAKKRIYPRAAQGRGALLSGSAAQYAGRQRAVGRGARGARSPCSSSMWPCTGRIIESTGKHLELEITARDAAGRVWIDGKRYEGDADIGSYKTDAALKARDPFQNVYSSIANDLLRRPQRLDAATLREIRQVAEPVVRGRSRARRRCRASCARTPLRSPP